MVYIYDNIVTSGLLCAGKRTVHATVRAPAARVLPRPGPRFRFKNQIEISRTRVF